MKNLYLTILISIFHLNVFSQSKKELKLIVERMKEDSVQIQKEFLLLDSTLNLKIFNLNNQINILKVEKNKMQNILNKQTKELNSLRPSPEEVEVIYIEEEGIRIDLPNPEPIICCVIPEINVEMEEEEEEQEQIFDVVEENPKFKGGMEELEKFLGKHLKYPKKAKENGIEGKVFVQFVVLKNGEIRDVKILKGAHEMLDKEAIRVIKMMPKWIPGKQRGKEVNSRFTLPVRFKI